MLNITRNFKSCLFFFSLLGLINHFYMVSNPILLLNSFTICSYVTEQKLRGEKLPSVMAVITCRSFWLACWCAWGMVDFQHTTSNFFVSLKTQYVISYVHFNSLKGHLILFYGVVITLSLAKTLGKSNVRHFKTCFWGMLQTTTISYSGNYT